MDMNKVRSAPKAKKVFKIKVRKVRSERQNLVKLLDMICREIVLQRDGRCVCAAPSKGHSGVRQCGHLVSRTKESVRWDLYNTNEQCSSCNMLHEYNPHRYVVWFIGAHGESRYLDLTTRAEQVSKLQVYELRELYEQLQKIRYKQLETENDEAPFKPYFTQQEIMSGAWNK